MDVPRRIVSLLSSATEMLYAVGVGERVVAVSHECDYPPGVEAKPRATRSRVDSEADSLEIDRQVRELSEAGRPLYEVDGPLLAELAPQLIVTQAQCDVCAVRYEDVLTAVERYLPANSTNVLALNPNSLEDVLQDLLRVGQAAGAAESAGRVVAQLRERVERVRGAGGEAGFADTPPRVICLEWLEPLMTASNWTPQLIEWAGGESGLTEAGRHSGYVDWKAIRDYDPQLLIIAPCGFDLDRCIREAQRLPALPGWSRLSAVRDGRVFALDGNAYLNRSGPRLVTTLEILAHLVHPDLDIPLQPAERRRAFCRLRTIEGELRQN